MSATSSETARFASTISADSLLLDADGVVDFGNQSGSATMKDVSTPTTDTTDPSDASDPQQSSGSADLRWIGSMSYSKDDSDSGGPLAANPKRPWIATDIDKMERAMCVVLPASVAAGAIGSGLGVEDPSAALDRLRANGATLAKVGDEDVRGVATTHWSVSLGPPPTTTTIPGCTHIGSGGHRNTSDGHLDIWTDAQDRLRREKESYTTTSTNTASSTPTSSEFTHTTTQTTELYDFGTPVDVQAPPANQILDQTESLVGLSRGPGTVADDGWHVVAQGKLDSGAYSVWYAETTTGWRCYDTTGGVAGFSSSILPSPLISIPKHEGRTAVCEPSGAMQYSTPAVLVAGQDGTSWIVVGKIPEGVGDATIVLQDKSTATLTVDAATRLFNWSGTVAPTKVVTDSGTCPLTTDRGRPAYDACNGDFGNVITAKP